MFYFSPKFCPHFADFFFFKAPWYINSIVMFFFLFFKFHNFNSLLYSSKSVYKNDNNSSHLPPSPNRHSSRPLHARCSLQQLLLTLHITAYDVCGHIDTWLRFLPEEFFQLCLFGERDFCSNVPLLDLFRANQRHEETTRLE